jgi:hypothetical protein
MCLAMAGLAQHGGHGRHGVLHKSRLVVDKQYVQNGDSGQFSAELFCANFNNWTGDNYGYQPSLQGLFTWDNNRNMSVGLFGCLNVNGSHNAGLYSNGADVFFSRALSGKLMVIVDAYAYFNRPDSLRSFFGYNASLYQLYSGRLRYDINKRFSVIAGYSALNDRDSLLQSVSLEVDYNLTPSIVMLVSYSTGNELLNFKTGSFGAAVGLTYSVKRLNFSFALNPWLSQQPPSYYGIPAYSPFLVSVSSDLVKSLRKRPAVKK